ncbi:type I-C CRISPR-associated protein Cas5c [Caniella muris]|uniref:type I-C CRISPR-associated protein Cas5c n=1 Tax=Caniella muris TaxID=2941502 RepID=UPI0020420DE8|nr:type I-C CRISPR-associated protein Cas5c [Caniella muris]
MLTGPFAAYNRPEMPSERETYPVPTPSALVGTLESIYWNPGLTFRIRKIHVLNPIDIMGCRRNEVASPAPSRDLAKFFKDVARGMERKEMPCYDTAGPKKRQQRAAPMLVDVAYIVEADMVDNPLGGVRADPDRSLALYCKSVRKGAHMNPYLGTEDCPCEFSLARPEDFEGAYTHCPPMDLGWVFHSWDRTDPGRPRPRFFHCILDHGVIDVEHSEVAAL